MISALRWSTDNPDAVVRSRQVWCGSVALSAKYEFLLRVPTSCARFCCKLAPRLWHRAKEMMLYLGWYFLQCQPQVQPLTLMRVWLPLLQGRQLIALHVSGCSNAAKISGCHSNNESELGFYFGQRSLDNHLGHSCWVIYPLTLPLVLGPTDSTILV